MRFCKYLNIVLLLRYFTEDKVLKFSAELEELLDTFHFGISFSFNRSHLSSCLILE